MKTFACHGDHFMIIGEENLGTKAEKNNYRQKYDKVSQNIHNFIILEAWTRSRFSGTITPSTSTAPA